MRESEDIAILGYAFRLPGANSIPAWKELLFGDVCAIRRFSQDELLAAGVTPDEFQRDGYVPVSGYLDGAAEFDAGVFKLTRQEAEIADPQLRKLLECAHEALDNAGMWQSRFVGRTGVFTASGMALYAGEQIDTYLNRQVRPCVELLRRFNHLQIMALNNTDWLATTISYRLNLTGPSVNVQTACSSSLTAIHAAVTSLRRRECDAAIAGAAAIHVPLKKGYVYSEGSIFSRSGRCLPFSDEADGTVGGCGAGAIVLKRLNDAIADGDRIRAVIKGIAINNDGARKVSFMAPSVQGQRESISAALQDSGVGCETIGLVEAHGTATKIGDPIEVGAFTDVFRRRTQQRNFVALGSVKSNVGHLDTAAGMAAVMKVLVALEFGRIPGTVGFERPNPLLKLDASPFFVNGTTIPWDATIGQPRRALISSLGAGGTNVAAVFEAWESPQPSGGAASPLLLCLSAATPEALRDQCRRYRHLIQENPDDAADICNRASTCLRIMEHRVAVSGEGVEELLTALRLHEDGGNHAAGSAAIRNATETFCGDGVGNWSGVFGAMPVGIDLPCYPWLREEFWLKGSQPTPVTTPGIIGQVVWEQCGAEGTSNEASGSVVVFQPAGCSTSDVGRFLTSAGYEVELVEIDTSASVHSCPPRTFGVFWAPPALPLTEAVMGLAAIFRQIDENQLTLTGLAVVTSGAVPMDEDRCGSELYGLWGMVRAARTELKGLPIHLWDVASTDGEGAWRGLVDEMRRSTPELELVIDGGRWRPVLVPCEEVLTASKPNYSEGWTLVTGAGGGLARILVGKLAEQGCRRFVLMGRTAPLRGLEALQERSDCELVAVEIELGTADAANRLADLSPQLSGVKHVYHLAGALADATIARLDADQCETVFRPKVAGLRQLASALGGLQRLETFVCYSSAASVLGHPGQAFYAAANAFMDHFVFHLRTMGVPAQSVSWGPWADAGMAARIATPRSSLQQRSLNTTTGLKAIDRILSSNLPHALVMPDIAALLPVPRPSLPDVAAALWGAIREEAARSGSADVPRLVSSLVAEILGLPVEQVAPDKPFSELGLDSLSLVTLKNEINRRFGTTLPTSAFYNHPTISQVSKRIGERQGSREESRNAVGEPQADRRVTGNTCAAIAASAGRVPVAEDIAVVGIGCRLPREIRGAEQLWDALRQSYSGIGPLPKSRINLELYGNVDRQAAEKIYIRKGGFLDSCVDEFDPAFFSLSPRSAEAMDPQHRLLLTVAWEAIEHAGLSRRRLTTGKTGVYMGLGTDDFAYLVHNKGDHITADRVLGANRGVGVGRIAFCLGLKGPAIAVDTTCSSSLAAAHLAIQGLRAGDCDVALAGGVHLILTPENILARCQLGVLSASDRLAAFDNDGDGFVQGEGCGVVVLRRLADAVADGDNILAVIEASALNHNGGGNGIQAPNGCAQADLIKECLEAAKCDPSDVVYVETHGTGTKLGDPIEFEGLANSYGARRNPDHPLLIGSIKTNFGHLEPAAGIASFIKAVLIVDRGEIPPQLNFCMPNEHIPWGEAAVRVADKLEPLPCPPGRTPRVAVSAFGISGANAHIILRRYHGTEKAAKTMSHYCLPISAMGAEALAAVTAATGELLARRPDELPSICYTAAVGRSHYRDRIAVTGANHLEIAAALKAAQPAGSRNPPRTAIAFGGQGAQMAQAGADLYEHFPAFRHVIDRCHDLLLDKDGTRNLRQLLFAADDEVLRRTENAQPVIYAFGWAVLALLRSVGVEPQAYIGHSVGEFIAAAAARVWSFEEGFSLVVDRGQMMARLPSGGEMLHIDQDADTVVGLLAELRSCTDIAAHNSNNATVVAGAAESIAALIEACKARNYGFRKLPVSHAFHSRLLDPVLEEWRARLQGVSTLAALPIASNRHGRMATTEFGSADYWVEHMRAPVLFRQGVAALAEAGIDLVIEVGPRPILTGHILRDVPAMRTAAPGSSYRSFSEFIAEYYLLGGDLRWEGFYPDPGAHRKTELPGHPLKRGRFNHTLEHLKTERENMLSAQNLTTVDRLDNRQSVVDRLRSIFSDLLGIDGAALDAEATFLSLGADSYVLVSALSKIKQAWSCQLQLRSLFEQHNSIHKLASYIDRSRAAEPVGAQDVGAPRLSNLDPVAKDDAQVAPGNRPDDPLPLSDFKTPAFASVVPPRAPKPQQETQRSGRSGLSSDYLQRFVSEYRTRTKGSHERAAASRSHLCNNRRSAASDHPEARELSYPIMARSSRGSRFWDVDGNEYIDLALGFGACLFGHKPDFIDAALQKQLELGYQIGPESELAGENASMIAELTGLDRVLFNNSGSEAIFTAIRLARAATGRTKIVVFQNSYHGHSDEVLVVPDLDDAFYGARPMVAGIPAEKVGAVVMLPYGGDRALDYLRGHASELAAVLVEPVQNRRPNYHPEEFLRQLRHITAESRTPLIFDEVLVGFRIAPGGAAEWFGVKPDMATYGKVVGGGLPLGVVAGARWCMDAVDNGSGTPSGQKTYTAGTFCKHPLAMAAANAVLKKLSAEGKDVTSRLNERATGLVTILNQSFTAERVPVRAYNFGSFFRFSQADNLSFLFQPLELQIFVYHLVHNGVYVWEGGTCFISTEHSDDDMDRIIGVTHNAVGSMKRGGFWSDEASAARMPGAGRKESGLSRAMSRTVDA